MKLQPYQKSIIEAMKGDKIMFRPRCWGRTYWWPSIIVENGAPNGALKPNGASDVSANDSQRRD